MRTMLNLLVRLVRAYQRLISPLLAPACRFVPSCSDYAIEAFSTHGALKGLLLTAWRLARCHPLCPGGYDPVPPAGGFALTWRAKPWA